MSPASLDSLEIQRWSTLWPYPRAQAVRRHQGSLFAVLVAQTRGFENSEATSRFRNEVSRLNRFVSEAKRFVSLMSGFAGKECRPFPARR
jgi:hypothetical protein